MDTPLLQIEKDPRVKSVKDWMIEQCNRNDFFTEQECLIPRDRNISGGKMTLAEIDILKDRSDINKIMILGLNQQTFEYFIDTYGQRFEVINFFKCPLISDFSKLEKLENLKYVLFFWNQRAEQLWDMSNNRSLIGIKISDFSRLHHLDELAQSPHLEEVDFGDAVWDGFVLDSLAPLAECGKLKRLSFSAKKILDSDIAPLAHIPNLEELDFADKLFTTEQIAWLTPSCQR
jgi:hypothetical protein